MIRMGPEHHVAIYLAVGLVLFAVGALSEEGQERLARVSNLGGWRGGLALLFGILVGIAFWPLVLAGIGIAASMRARTKCGGCGAGGRGRTCPECKEKIVEGVRADMAAFRTARWDPGAGPFAHGVAAPMEPPEPRKFVCEMPCPVCRGRSVLYSGDHRTGYGLLRHECDAGHWGDLDPRSVLIPERFRSAGGDHAGRP
jgi:hypothetical protein